MSAARFVFIELGRFIKELSGPQTSVIVVVLVVAAIMPLPMTTAQQRKQLTMQMFLHILMLKFVL